ncbi:MAG: T9SS type A sorting domain-containing protein [Bacteroides sp.]|nr:T9SS type A sorting domain-containing protein [Bacteroides sp.]
MFFNKGTTIVSLILAAGLTSAQADIKPCIILRGDGVADHNADLEQFDRITFGPESMTLTNSADPTISHELPYAQYNRILLGQAEPTASIIEITESHTAADGCLHYDKVAQNITVLNSSEPLSVSVFNSIGSLLLKDTLSQGETLSVSTLPQGLNVVIATGSTATHTLKFIK